MRKGIKMHYEEIDVEGKVQLNNEGKIDAATSNDFQSRVLATFTKSNSVILNLEKVTYMSSAGLRALILGDKTAKSKGGQLVIINVPSNVQDVFRVTGFNSILDIR